MSRRGVLAATAACLFVAGGGAARATAPAVSQAAETDVSATGDWHAGEPELAVNPLEPDNVVMVWPEENATGLYRNPVTGTFDAATGTAVGYANDPSFSRCGLAVSFDGGTTWTRSVLPAQTAQSTLCSDATVAAGPDGTFYATVITFHQPTIPIPGVAPGSLPEVWDQQPGQGSADVVVSSTDGGRTWSFPPVDAIGNRGTDASRFAPGSTPETGGEGTSDRPWISVDQTTGDVFVTAMSDLIQFNGTTRTESWVTGSSDHAGSFGTIYPVDSPQYPQVGPASMAAAGGTLAMAYIGTVGSSSSSNVIIFETSEDGGKTFTRHVLHSSGVLPSGIAGGVDVINLAADPTRAGSYAVSVSGGGSTGMLVYVTSDGGTTWSGPVTVAVGTDRPWLAYGPSGDVLGIMGRYTHSDKSQDVLFSISTDGGRHFGPVQRANRATSPPPPPGTVSLYDDVSWITIGHDYAYLAWGDWRKTPQDPNGEVNAWMAREPIIH